MKVAINGFGRIGRLFFKQIFEQSDVEIVAINDLGDLENLAYLLEFDSVYRHWEHDIKVDIDKKVLTVDGKDIQFVGEKELTKLPWKKYDVDVVVEATGIFTAFEKARPHLEAGAKRVAITAPAKDEEGPDARTILNGVNEELFETCKITSNGSCTTNSASPLMSILLENPGVEKAMLTTVHGYTATQKLVDGPDAKDWRKGRAAASNIVPSSTGAAIAVARAIEPLRNKFDGIAMRVPVIVGSLSDITFIAKRDTSVEEINDILRKGAKLDKWKGVFTVTEKQLVSSDIIAKPYGAIADLTMTRVVDGNLVKVLSWYDNEYGYVRTLVEHVLKLGKTIK
ncbi:MAG: type I glyceraldehyde-3-phosphate dehydrogenase [bacterium]|nr:type I glyceraldehyde-3-phosphate dehydrogenase [bacterium]